MDDDQGVTDADGNEGMTDAVVKLMREMEEALTRFESASNSPVNAASIPAT